MKCRRRVGNLARHLAGLLLVASCANPSVDLSQLPAGAAVVRIDTYAQATAAVDPEFVHEILSEANVRSLIDAENEIDTGFGGSRTGFLVHSEGLIVTAGDPALELEDSQIEEALAISSALRFLSINVDSEIRTALQRGENFERLLDRLAAGVRLSDIRTTSRVVLSNGAFHPFEIVTRGDQLSVLRIDGTGLPSLQAPTSVDVEPVWFVGFPTVAKIGSDGWHLTARGLESRWHEVRGSAEREDRGPSDPGLYGAPMLSSTALLRDVWLDSSRTAADEMRQIFLSLGPDRDESTGALIRQAVDRARAGGLGDSIELLEQAEAAFPGSPDLIRASAQIRAVQASSPSRSSYLVILGVSLLVGVVLVGLLRSGFGRRSRAPIAVTEVRDVHPFVYPAQTLAQSDGVVRLGGVTIVEGTPLGVHYEIHGPGVRIGRDRRVCEIVLDDPRISRVHAEFQVSEGETILLDNESSNGTWVNGRQIERAKLSEGDIIHFGGRGAIGAVYSSHGKKLGR